MAVRKSKIENRKLGTDPACWACRFDRDGNPDAGASSVESAQLAAHRTAGGQQGLEAVRRSRGEASRGSGGLTRCRGGYRTVWQGRLMEKRGSGPPLPVGAVDCASAESRPHWTQSSNGAACSDSTTRSRRRSKAPEMAASISSRLHGLSKWSAAPALKASTAPARVA